jgi:hypothetical protein
MKFGNWKVASITRFFSSLIFLTNQILIVTVIPEHLNFATFSNDLLAIFILCFCPAFWLEDTNMYQAFSVFTSRPTFILNMKRNRQMSMYTDFSNNFY